MKAMFLWNVGWLSTDYTALYPPQKETSTLQDKKFDQKLQWTCMQAQQLTERQNCLCWTAYEANKFNPVMLFHGIKKHFYLQ
jgi:hypothetical protein